MLAGCSVWCRGHAERSVPRPSAKSNGWCDRLPHSATVVNVRGRSYRMRAHQDLPKAKTVDEGLPRVTLRGCADSYRSTSDPVAHAEYGD